MNGSLEGPGGLQPPGDTSRKTRKVWVRMVRTCTGCPNLPTEKVKAVNLYERGKSYELPEFLAHQFWALDACEIHDRNPEEGKR